MKTKSATALVVLFAGLINAHAASSFKKVPGNKLLHPPSNVSFPVTISLFNRVGTHVYGSMGRDVSVRYVEDAFIVGDVYVYPVGTYGKDLNSEFRIQQNAIQMKNKKVKLVSQSNVETTQGHRSIRGKWANYELVRGLFSSDTDRKCGSQLFVFQDGPWFVAYRFSYPRERSEIANQHVSSFLRQWQWRGR